MNSLFLSCSTHKIQAWHDDQNISAPLFCEARLRASNPDDKSAGSLRIHLKAELNREKSKAEWLVRDPFMNPLAKMIQDSKGNHLQSQKNSEIQRALKDFPHKKWWKWLSFLLAHPQIEASDSIEADLWNRPIRFVTESVSFECRYTLPQDSMPTACTIHNARGTIGIEFTLADCRPQLD